LRNVVVKAAVLAFFFGGLGLFYLGFWPGALGVLAWSVFLGLADWTLTRLVELPDNLFGFVYLLMNVLFVVIAVQLCKRRNRAIPADLPEPPKKATPPLRKSLKIAIGLFLLDAFFLNQGIITAVFFVVVLLGFLPLALWSAVRKRWPQFRLRMAHFAIYATACFAVFAANYFHNSMADRRAIRLGEACKQYHAKYNRYPRNLSELEPEFISSVPAAKYAFMDSSFFYCNFLDDPEVWYVAMPPFGRRFYHVKTGHWGYLD